MAESVIQLPTEVWQRIVQLGVERHIQELEAQLEEAQQQIAEFGRKFGMSFVDLEQEACPKMRTGMCTRTGSSGAVGKGSKRISSSS
jgi:hypothetical protein